MNGLIFIIFIAGGQKLSMPVMMTADLWRTTGRWDKNGSEMIKFKDRKGEEYCLGPTHEELITQIVTNDVFSYKSLPLRLYQIGNKIFPFMEMI
jgi:prolyl-tRNA synthetase